MQVDALVHHPLSRAGLRSVVPLSYRPGARARLHFAADWAELLERGQEGMTEVGVVDPAIGSHGDSYDQLHRLRHLLGMDRIILYVQRDGMDPGLLQALGRTGYRLILTQGVNDDRASFERALATAGIRARTVSGLAHELGYGDHSSLCRACRRLTGLPASKLFAPEGHEAAVTALVERLMG